MISNIGVPRVNPNWFVRQGRNLKATDEPVNLVHDTTNKPDKAQPAVSGETREQLSDRLTKEQMEYLSSVYDPENMSYSDYLSFLDDLCKFGYFAEEDRILVGGDAMMVGDKTLIKVSTETLGAFITRDIGTTYSRSFSSSGANALDWSRHLSTYGAYNAEIGRFEQTHQAKVYEKLYDVLSQLKKAG